MKKIAFIVIICLVAACFIPTPKEKPIVIKKGQSVMVNGTVLVNKTQWDLTVISR